MGTSLSIFLSTKHTNILFNLSLSLTLSLSFFHYLSSFSHYNSCTSVFFLLCFTFFFFSSQFLFLSTYSFFTIYFFCLLKLWQHTCLLQTLGRFCFQSTDHSAWLVMSSNGIINPLICPHCVFFFFIQTADQSLIRVASQLVDGWSCTINKVKKVNANKQRREHGFVTIIILGFKNKYL